MKTATIYKCTNATEATDRANMYYISVSAARAIKRDNENKQIQVLNQRQTIIAIFAY